MFDKINKENEFETNDVSQGIAGMTLGCSAVSIFIVLFDILWYMVWQHAIKVCPPCDTFYNKAMFYGVCIATLEVFVSVVTMGYGLLGIPASILSFLVLVFLL